MILWKPIGQKWISFPVLVRQFLRPSATGCRKSVSSSTSVVRAFRTYARELPKILWLPPIPSPQRLLVAFLFRSACLALWADALKPLPPHRLNLALRFSAERAKARIERIPRRFQDFHWHRLSRFNSVAAGVPLRLSIEKRPEFHHCLCHRLPGYRSAHRLAWDVIYQSGQRAFHPWSPP